MFLVVGDVAVKFGLPPFGTRFRGGCTLAPLVPMPEAAVNKDYRSEFRQDNVRFAGQFPVVGSVHGKAVASTVE